MVRVDVGEEDSELVGIDVGEEDGELVGVGVGNVSESDGLIVSDKVGKLVDNADGEGDGSSVRNFPYTSTSAKLKRPLCVSRDVPLIRTI